jgi:hypothetical protein
MKGFSTFGRQVDTFGVGKENIILFPTGLTLATNKFY